VFLLEDEGGGEKQTGVRSWEGGKQSDEVKREKGEVSFNFAVKKRKRERGKRTLG